MAWRVQKNGNGLDTLIQALPSNAEKSLDRAGEGLETKSRGQVRAMDVYDTGKLHDSTEWEKTEPLAGRVATTAESDEGALYPMFQHEGWTDRAGNWHVGRPFLRVAAEEWRGGIPQYFRGMVEVR
jgi:hypothetical protein